MLILKDEHAIDVLKSGNTGHLWHDFHAIGVHATDVGHPDDDYEDGSKDDDDDEDGSKDRIINVQVRSEVSGPQIAACPPAPSLGRLFP